MIGVARIRGEVILVANNEGGERHVARVVMVSEGEAVMSDTSRRLRVEAVPRTPQQDGRLGHLSSIAG
jgi:hypothetical protein